MMTRKMTIKRMTATAEHPTMVHLMADQTITDHPMQDLLILDQATKVLQVLETIHQMQ